MLQLFTAEQPTWSVDGAAAALGLTQSTAYSYFRPLIAAGLIAPTGGGRYVLGSAIIEFDRVARISDPMLVEGSAVLDEMVDAPPVPLVGLLCRLYRMKVMCIDQRASIGADFAVSYERGRPMPLLRGAASKVILAHIERRRMRRFFDENCTDVGAEGLGETWSEFRLAMRRIRSHGVYVTRGELDQDRVGLSSVLLDQTGEVIGSLSLVVGAAEYDRSDAIRSELHDRVLTGAHRTLARIGQSL